RSAAKTATVKKSRSQHPKLLKRSVSKSESAKPGGRSFPIVGIGASAGGLGAISQMLVSLPSDTGMGFVVVQHLDPNHKSALAEILARQTRMLVCEAVHNSAIV